MVSTSGVGRSIRHPSGVKQKGKENESGLSEFVASPTLYGANNNNNRRSLGSGTGQDQVYIASAFLILSLDERQVFVPLLYSQSVSQSVTGLGSCPGSEFFLLFRVVYSPQCALSDAALLPLSNGGKHNDGRSAHISCAPVSTRTTFIDFPGFRN